MGLSRKGRAKRKLLTIITLITLIEVIYPHSVTAQVVRKPLEEKIKPVFLEEEISIIKGNNCTDRECRLPEIADRPAKKSFYLTATAYSSSPDECSGDPFITASGTRTRTGVIAYNFLPLGTKVRFPEVFGDQIFTIEDRLADRAGRYLVDIWMPSKAEAKQWGAKILKIEIL